MSEDGELFDYVLDGSNGSVSDGEFQEGETISDVLQRNGVTQAQIDNREVTVMQDGVIAGLEAEIESLAGTGVVHLALTIKADNG